MNNLELQARQVAEMLEKKMGGKYKCIAKSKSKNAAFILIKDKEDKKLLFHNITYNIAFKHVELFIQRLCVYVKLWEEGRYTGSVDVNADIIHQMITAITKDEYVPDNVVKTIKIAISRNPSLSKEILEGLSLYMDKNLVTTTITRGLKYHSFNNNRYFNIKIITLLKKVGILNHQFDIPKDLSYDQNAISDIKTLCKDKNVSELGVLYFLKLVLKFGSIQYNIDKKLKNTPASDTQLQELLSAFG